MTGAELEVSHVALLALMAALRARSGFIKNGRRGVVAVIVRFEVSLCVSFDSPNYRLVFQICFSFVRATYFSGLFPRETHV